MLFANMETVDAKLEDANVQVYTLGTATTVMVATLANGYEITETITGPHPSVSSYQEDIESWLYDKIRNKLFELENYAACLEKEKADAEEADHQLAIKTAREYYAEHGLAKEAEDFDAQLRGPAATPPGGRAISAAIMEQAWQDYVTPPTSQTEDTDGDTEQARQYFLNNGLVPPGCTLEPDPGGDGFIIVEPLNPDDTADILRGIEDFLSDN